MANIRKFAEPIRIGSLASAPSSPQNGTMYYDSTSLNFQFYQNGAWKPLFVDPLTTRGDLVYRGASSTTRLALGTASYVLMSDGTDAAYGQIVNASVAAAAGILESKLTLDYSTSSLNSAVSGKVSKSGDSMTGALAMGNNKITGLAAPTANGDALRYDQLGANSGIATLDGSGKVPVTQLPNSVMEYQGAWNAFTNSPALADGTGNAGDVYRVSTAGTQDLGSGAQSFAVGDLVIYSGSVWQLSPRSTDYATKALDNLASVAINTSLLPASAGSASLGDAAKPWAHISAMSGVNLFKSSGGFPVRLLPPTTEPAAVIGYSLPAAYGSAGQVLSDNGSGALSWVNQTSIATLATKALDNLASVAINTSLISDTDATDDLGSSAIAWKDLYLSGIAQFKTNSQTTSLAGHASASASVAYQLPAADGSAGQVLSTNASGVMSWVNQTSITNLATKALDNLASTAVNVDIKPASDNNIQLGTSALNWSAVYTSVLASGADLTIDSEGDLTVYQGITSEAKMTFGSSATASMVKFYKHNVTVADAASTIVYSFDRQIHNGAVINYLASEASGGTRVGQLFVVCKDGSANVSISDSSTDQADIGVAFSVALNGNIAEISATATSTGNARRISLSGDLFKANTFA